MEYEILDIRYTEKYIESYRKSIEEDEEEKCIMGQESEYRMNGRESVVTSLTDPIILLEYCIYPMYDLGDKMIGGRIEKYLKDIVDSEDIIGIYQVVKFIYCQDKLIKNYDEVPIIIEVKGIVPLLVEKIAKLSDSMKIFKEGEFSSFSKSIYDMIQAMIRKSDSFN